MAILRLLGYVIFLGLLRTSVGVSEEDILNGLFNKTNYDRTVGPYTITDEPTLVSIDFVILGLGPIDALSMEYSMSMYFRQQWIDPRLSHYNWNRSIQTNYRRLDNIWVPDVFFPSAKTEKRHIITIPNMFIRIEPDGTVIYSQRLSVTIACLMDLRKFPLDAQTCSFRMESYGYTTNEMYLEWSKDRKFTNVLPSTNIPDFEMTAISAHDCTANLQTGNFPCLYANLQMQRQIGFYLTQTYVPSILIVVLSWVSFWIDPTAIPARISVGLLTVLTITTQSSGARSQLPRVPYTKSIDVWMSACLVFVFAAYVEYAFVTVLSRRHIKKKADACKDKATHRESIYSSISSSMSKLGDEIPIHQNKTTDKKTDQTIPTPSCVESRDLGRFVDKLARYFFPISFSFFNICYWVYYVDFS